MDKVRSEFEALKFHERCLNMEETRYWLQQYKQFAEKLVKALSSREGEAVARIERNMSGQIRIVAPNGDAFDMSQHVGVTLYAATRRAIVRAAAEIGKGMGVG